MKVRKIIYRVATALVAVATLGLSGYIIAAHKGLNDKLDFGAGAYYYADIPNFEQLEPVGVYTTSIPIIVYILLFLGWGFLMYRLWVWIDKR